jgi:hypothetical protein
MNLIIKIAILFFLTSAYGFSHGLKPGFDKNEYRELMYISARTSANENYYKNFPEPKEFRMIYQSKSFGLDNSWDLWKDNHSRAVISIRGTTEKQESWLANIYAAMTSAKGRLILNEKDTFNYKLAEDQKAAVHVGWLLATGYLCKEIVPAIKQESQNGVNDFIIVGHSQGGAIAYLLTAQLYYMQRKGELPANMRFKTYCSAAPKPGNLYFAYDYESLTNGGWAFNVVNAADWVPEVPISIQTLADFNTSNPFTKAKDIIKSQKFPSNLVMKYIYNKLDKPTKKALANYKKYLGELASKIIKSKIEGYQAPDFYNSNYYVRTGTTVVLMPDADYYTKYPEKSDMLFPHHYHDNYLYLLEKLK